MTRVPGLACGCLLVATTALAQGPRAESSFNRVVVHLERPANALLLAGHRDSIVFPRTYWREGAIAGGIVLGTMAAVGAVQMCGYDGPCRQPALKAVGAAVLGGFMGAGLGGLVGGLFPKP